MKLVVTLLVGNEIELIDAHINYHLGLGACGMVIADICSTDGTTERLAHYARDPRLVIRRFEEESLFDAQGMHMSDVWSWTLDAARGRFAPDWVVRLDADEFLMPKSPDLEQAFLAHRDDAAVCVPRYNAVFRAGPPPTFAGPLSYRDLAGQAVVSKPVPPDMARAGQSAALPLNMTSIISKVAVRPERVANFTMGGHGAVDAAGSDIAMKVSQTLSIVHYWFTTLSRFQRKSAFLLDFEQRFRRYMPQDAGPQWSYWARTALKGPEAVSTEFARQFLDPDMLARLVAEGVVTPAGHVWSDRDG